MRSILIQEIQPETIGDQITVTGDQAKHLIQSARIKNGENVLILNGQGLKVFCQVAQVFKKDLVLSVIKVELSNDERKLSLILAPPKKDAFEEIIKKSVEIGIKKMILFDSEYSFRSKYNHLRMQKIIESAVIQSNNPFKLEIEFKKSFEEVLKDVPSQNIVYFSSIEESSSCKADKNELYLLIGPEGGFSEEEERTFTSLKIKTMHLPTNILRSPTAVCVASGYLLALSSVQKD